MRIVPSLTLFVTLTIPLAGCSGFVTDYKILEAYAKSPKVEYGDPDRWACEIAKGTTTRGAVEDCGRGRNASDTAQVVTINGEAHVAQPGQQVIRCSDNARLMAMEPLPSKPPSPTGARR